MSDLCEEHEIVDINHNASDQEDIQEASIGFKLLRLDSFTDHHHHPPCTTCGCSCSFLPPTSTATTTFDPPSSTKRRSPDFTSSTTDSHEQQQRPKKPKKLFTDPPETTTITSSGSLLGFSKIPLPFNLSGSSNSAHVNNHPLLRRCASDPTNPPVAGSYSSAAGTANLVPQSPPESAKTAGANAASTPASRGSASLPPRPPSIRRTVSDPSPSKSFSRSSSCNGDEGSNYQWLKKMRDCMKQMSQLWDEYMPDEVMGEDEEKENKATDDTTTTVEAINDDSATDFDEAVSVERAGECFIINFKCPCGKGYQILLSGRSCYYKLL